MRRFHGWWRVAALMTALVVFGAACGESDGEEVTPADDPGDDTTIVVGAAELPVTLNMIHLDAVTSWTVWTTSPALARGYRVQPDFSYEPWVFEEDCTIESDEPFAVSCSIRDEAAWSDGADITAEDFRFSYEAVIDEDHEVFSTIGFEDITEFEVTGPKSFTVTFAEPYPAFRDLWASGSMLMPEHVLAGQDLNTVWRDCICDPETGDPIGSGPYLVESFDPDEQLTLVRNSEYWDGEAKTERVTFVLTPEVDTQVNALAARDVGLIFPQETVELSERIEAIDDVTLQSDVGFSFEQLSLLTTTPGLDDVEVRRAIATALPRDDVVTTVVRPVADDATVLDNSIYVTNQEEYVPNWDIYPASGDPDAAAAILDQAGWELDGDGVRTRDDVALSFTFGTTAGDQGRELAQQIIQDRLGEIGIEVEIDNAVDFFDRLDAGEYPLALYAFDSVPEPVAWVLDIYASDSFFNATLQSDDEVDALLSQARSTVDPEARAGLLDAADRRMATDVVSVIPLYQKPAVLAHRDSISGPELNVTLEGFTWNIEEWERSG